jgi:ankyrin repeat protein
MVDIFIHFCIRGNLNGIIDLINKNNINIHTHNEYGFRSACENGHKHVVEYLINLYKIRPSRYPIYAKINIHANNEEGFRWACMNRHKHTIKYLINLHKINPIYDKINIHVDNEYGFKKACIHKHKYIIKYLLSCGSYSNNYKCIIIL